jgi:hypothetical protein
MAFAHGKVTRMVIQSWDSVYSVGDYVYLSTTTNRNAVRRTFNVSNAVNLIN